MQRLGELAEPALGRVAGDGDLEVRRPAELLLSRLAPPVRDGERLRAIRSVEMLELIGSELAMRLLEWLSSGMTEARLTQEAQTSFQ